MAQSQSLTPIPGLLPITAAKSQPILQITKPSSLWSIPTSLFASPLTSGLLSELFCHNQSNVRNTGNTQSWTESSWPHPLVCKDSLRSLKVGFAVSGIETLWSDPMIPYVAVWVELEVTNHWSLRVRLQTVLPHWLKTDTQTLHAEGGERLGWRESRSETK